jgi:hypothetical protein
LYAGKISVPLSGERGWTVSKAEARQKCGLLDTLKNREFSRQLNLTVYIAEQETHQTPLLNLMPANVQQIPSTCRSTKYGQKGFRIYYQKRIQHHCSLESDTLSAFPHY